MGENGHPSPVSVVIPSWNSKQITHDCLASLAQGAYESRCEIIVVDNGSHDGSPEMIARTFPQVRLIANSKNEYFSKACNQGAAVAGRPYVCLLNSDTIVQPGSLEAMVAFLQAHPEYGAVAPQLRNPDGSIQAICRRFPGLMEPLVDQFRLSWWRVAREYQQRVAMTDFDHLTDLDVEQPPGACLMMRRADFLGLGGFDENLPLFYSDVDLCLRIWRSGCKIRFLTGAPITHVGSASITRHPIWRAEYMRDQVRYFRKLRGRAAGLFVKAIILLSAIYTSARTTLGSKTVQRKVDYLALLWRSTIHVMKA